MSDLLLWVSTVVSRLGALEAAGTGFQDDMRNSRRIFSQKVWNRSRRSRYMVAERHEERRGLSIET